MSHTFYGGWFYLVWTSIWQKVGRTHRRRPKRQKEDEGNAKIGGAVVYGSVSVDLFQVLVLSHLIADSQRAGGLERSLWIWAAFIVPTIAGTVMWGNYSKQMAWSRMLIQGGYQLVLFIIFGLVLSNWK
ncbi:MAG: DUF1761 domain-containing protein [bacterium]|nr:DUF1761 domain-containing protein [bacterium]